MFFVFAGIGIATVAIAKKVKEARQQTFPQWTLTLVDHNNLTVNYPFKYMIISQDGTIKGEADKAVAKDVRVRGQISATGMVEIKLDCPKSP